METKKFKSWLNYRSNNLNEGFWDWMTGKKQQVAPPKDPIMSPDEIYYNPEVTKWYNDLVEKLMLKEKLNEIDSRGNVLRPFNGSIPRSVEQALQRFIASHLFGKGQEKSFLQPSYHDATAIIDFLDGLQLDGSHNTLAQTLRIEDPQSLAWWVHGKVPASKEIHYQNNYNTKYARPTVKSKQTPEIDELAKSIVQLLQALAPDKGLIHTKKGTVRRVFVGLVPQINHLIQTAKAAFPQVAEIQALPEVTAAASTPATEEEEGIPGNVP